MKAQLHDFPLPSVLEKVGPYTTITKQTKPTQKVSHSTILHRIQNPKSSGKTSPVLCIWMTVVHNLREVNQRNLFILAVEQDPEKGQNFKG